MEILDPLLIPGQKEALSFPNTTSHVRAYVLPLFQPKHKYTRSLSSTAHLPFFWWPLQKSCALKASCFSVDSEGNLNS